MASETAASKERMILFLRFMKMPLSDMNRLCGGIALLFEMKEKITLPSCMYLREALINS